MALASLLAQPWPLTSASIHYPYILPRRLTFRQNGREKAIWTVIAIDTPGRTTRRPHIAICTLRDVLNRHPHIAISTLREAQFDALRSEQNAGKEWGQISYAQNGLSDEAIKFFNSMRMMNVEPNEITLIGVLSACASVGALDFGKRVDAYASQRGLQYNIYVATALIDMYAKCGSLDQALRVFDAMPQKNEVSWNAMISALAFHGQAQEALLLFKRMLKEGGTTRPNDITFIGVLSACVHVGLVDDGHRWFDLMSSSFGLVPKIEHYSCMVDLLARAGRVHEAWDFIENMPEKPDEVMLGALLGACKKLRNVDVSERAMKLLLELEPSNSGNYIISSKIYANMKRWDESARMRVLMRERGVAKTPGCSWIEIESQLREFHAGDDLHLFSIHQIFELLNEEMRVEGYIPKAECS